MRVAKLFPFLPILAVFMASGCANMRTYVPLDNNIQNQKLTVSVRSVITQDEIIVTAENPGASAAVGGGLIGAVIDSAIASERQLKIQDTIEPFYSSIDDVDFRAIFKGMLEKTLLKIPSLKVAEVVVTPKILNNNDRNELVTSMPTTQGLMHITTKYSFSSDYRKIMLASLIDLWQGGNTEKPAYSNNFYYISNPVPMDSENTINAWSLNNGERYKAAINEAAVEVASMLRIDLNNMVKTDTGSPEKTDLMPGEPQLFFGFPIKTSGELVRSESNRVVVRNEDGRLVSMPGKI